MADVLNAFYRNFSCRLEQPVRQHLKNVYACLTLSGIAAAAGVFMHIYTKFALSSIICSLIVLGLVIALKTTPHNGKNTPLRMSYLLGSGFTIGMGMAPLIDYSLKINPSLVLSAVLGTSFVFAGFSLSAIYAKRGYWLFLCGPITAMGSVMVILLFGNIFFGSYWVYKLNIYLGLIVMCGFVIFDTTLIIEKCQMGDQDFVLHALELFIDFIGMFKRILILLIEREENSRERRRNH